MGIAEPVSGRFATANPHRIKAAHRRRRKPASGQSVQRYYDPGIGHPLSRDPVTAYSSGDMRHFNAYAYAFNNPYRFMDPDGRSPVDDDPNHRPGPIRPSPADNPPPPPQPGESDDDPTVIAPVVVVASRSSESAKIAMDHGWFRPRGHAYKAGRVGHDLVSPGSPIGAFVDDHLPAGHTMAVNHDRLVDYLTDKGWPDDLANIPTMGPAYGYSFVQELANTNVQILNSIWGAQISTPFVHEDPP